MSDTISFPTTSYWLEHEPNEHGGQKHYTIFAGKRFDMFSNQAPFGWHKEAQDAINTCWSHYYRQLTDEQNKQLDFYNQILGYSVADGDHIYHPECLPPGFHLPKEEIAIDSDDILTLTCEQCHEPILDDELRDEFFDHQQNCDCEECLKAIVKAEQGFSDDYIAGYRAGLGGYAKERDMTTEEYARFRGFIPFAQFVAGYEAALKEGEAENE